MHKETYQDWILCKTIQYVDYTKLIPFILHRPIFKMLSAISREINKKYLVKTNRICELNIKNY